MTDLQSFDWRDYRHIEYAVILLDKKQNRLVVWNL